jgi:hypothetical protein
MRRSRWFKNSERIRGCWEQLTPIGVYKLNYLTNREDIRRGWYLFGPDGQPFGTYMALTVHAAKEEADRYIINPKKYWEDGLNQAAGSCPSSEIAVGQSKWTCQSMTDGIDCSPVPDPREYPV